MISATGLMTHKWFGNIALDILCGRLCFTGYHDLGCQVCLVTEKLLEWSQGGSIFLQSNLEDSGVSRCLKRSVGLTLLCSLS